MCGIAIYVGINMTTFRRVKERFGKKRDTYWGTAFQGMVMGFVSGTTAVAVSYPTDVIRSRIMMQGMVGQPTIYRSPLHAVSYMFVHDGIRSFYWGFLPTMIKVVPSTMISWGVMELCRAIGGEP